MHFWLKIRLSQVGLFLLIKCLSQLTFPDFILKMLPGGYSFKKEILVNTSLLRIKAQPKLSSLTYPDTPKSLRSLWFWKKNQYKDVKGVNVNLNKIFVMTPDPVLTLTYFDAFLVLIYQIKLYMSLHVCLFVNVIKINCQEQQMES